LFADISTFEAYFLLNYTSLSLHLQAKNERKKWGYERKKNGPNSAVLEG